MSYLNHTRATMNSRYVPGNAISNLVMQEPMWKLLLLGVVTWLIWSGRVTIVINGLESAPSAAAPEQTPDRASIFSLWNERSKRVAEPEASVELPDGALNNLTFAIDRSYARRNGHDEATVSRYMQRCQAYADRFAPVAIAEMRKYGIPASITLAQGLLESDAGESKLAQNGNNHFGIKCFSKRCKKGHCINFTDDSHKDFFVKYPNIWGSYRAHSEFLKNKSRYAHLFELADGDYRAWARGLAAAGYATDKKYGEKLIAIIQSLHLSRYDQKGAAHE